MLLRLRQAAYTSIMYGTSIHGIFLNASIHRRRRATVSLLLVGLTKLDLETWLEVDLYYKVV